MFLVVKFLFGDKKRRRAEKSKEEEEKMEKFCEKQGSVSLPDKIRQKIGDRAYQIDDIGKSDSLVICFDDMILKINEADQEAKNESSMLKWLRGRLPVPQVLCLEEQDGKQYLLMSRAEGEMACAEQYMREPQKLAKMLAEGLQAMWRVDISDIPSECGTLDKKLEYAKLRVKKHLCDMQDVEEGTYGEGGFENPEALLQWLLENRPREELVFSHGDCCLPNVFFKDGKLSGLIDLGRSGVMDRYQDIALCYRSLKHNYEGKYSPEESKDM